ncbi:MAG: SHOCT domain-containing protein [Actinobacteria bacterium]|nr:SHOCT domain-containing protein [Actinomycetota bacterium]
MMGPYGYGYGITGGIGMFLMTVFWILILVGGIFILKWIFVDQGRQGQPYKEEDALEVLKKRYAKGEINKEEFEEKKKDLM